MFELYQKSPPINQLHRDQRWRPGQPERQGPEQEAAALAQGRDPEDQGEEENPKKSRVCKHMILRLIFPTDL